MTETTVSDSDKARPPSRRVQLLVLVAVAGAAGAVWWMRLRPADVPPPPIPSRLGEADPAVQQLIQSGAHAVRDDPESPGAWSELGLMLEANAFDAEAADCYRVATSLDPTDWTAHYRLALVCGNRLSDVPAAIEHVTRAIELNPEFVPSHWRLGFWLLDDGQVDQAEQQFRRALELETTSVPARLGLARVRLDQTRYGEAVRLLVPIWRTTSPNTPYASFLLGRAYRGLGETQAAQTALARGRGSVPVLTDEVQARYMQYQTGVQPQIEYAKMLAFQGQTGQAAQVLQSLVERRPDDLNLLNNVAIAYRTNHQLDDAERASRDLLARHPGFAPAHVSLAITLHLKSQRPQADTAGLRDEAKSHLDVALAISPTLVAGLSQKAVMLAEDGAPAHAASLWLEAAAAEPSNPFHRLHAGRLLRASGKVEQSIEQLRFAADQAPIPAVHLELAHAYLDQHRLDEAAASIGAAIDLNRAEPGLEEAMNRLRSLQRQTDPLDIRRELSPAR